MTSKAPPCSGQYTIWPWISPCDSEAKACVQVSSVRCRPPSTLKSANGSGLASRSSICFAVPAPTSASLHSSKIFTCTLGINVLGQLDAAGVAVADLAPLDNRLILAHQILFQPVAILTVEGLQRLTRRDVVVVEALQRLRLPAVPERVIVLGALGVVGAALADGDDVEVRVLGDRHVPLELVEAVVREVVDAQRARHHDEIAGGALELSLLRRGVHLGGGDHHLAL